MPSLISWVPGFRHSATTDFAASDAKFQAIWKKEWAWRQEQRLEEEEDEEDHVKGYLPRVDVKTQTARLAYWSDIISQLDKIDPNTLSAEEQVNYGVYRAQIEVYVNSQKFKDYEKPLNADSSFWANQASAARVTFRTAHDYSNYLVQLKEVPRYFSEQIDNMRAGCKRGFTPPKITLQGRDSSISSVAEAKSAEKTIYYEPFKSILATIPCAEQEKLRAQAVKVIEDSVLPSYQKLLTFFRDEYYPNARDTLAAEAFPEGKAYFAAKIKEFTTLDLAPEAIHKIGVDEISRIHAEMLETIKNSGYKGDFQSFLNFLRTDSRFYAKTPEQLLYQAAWIAKEFDGVSGKYFGRLPRQRFAIKPVPADQAPFYTSGRGGPGVYLVNTYDLPSRALYSLPALTLHESAPGHAFQMPIALEHKSLPPFRKAYISAYGEGWALYCELLGKEMGMYHTPYDVFGMLSYQAWRAARLVVDTGIHSLGWSRAQAQTYLHDNTALSSHEIETEVDRYIAWPAQSLSYYLGELSILKCRRKAEEALGDKFNIRAFHDTVLETGSIPLPLLEQHIDRFIAGGGIGPYPEEEQ
ncbi:hypothetical protein I302_105761 [Kwoniella bestiolae CBS 10118]|uniref:DUF885 domain-containing protein n=1 Tax=Kwoniella bestiolae CBS 10118 TaxID=1296100 RepID=A0A1B9G225_9TREE|nr:hypothetical protein I302_04883 [Kwoniella bestiolae CBS 10118]OCF25073.1 hypothetical protein I302_04883 [Kwoniella bestiolae CBS 10118]